MRSQVRALALLSSAFLSSLTIRTNNLCNGGKVLMFGSYLLIFTTFASFFRSELCLQMYWLENIESWKHYFFDWWKGCKIATAGQTNYKYYHFTLNKVHRLLITGNSIISKYDCYNLHWSAIMWKLLTGEADNIDYLITLASVKIKGQLQESKQLWQGINCDC